MKTKIKTMFVTVLAMIILLNHGVCAYAGEVSYTFHAYEDKLIEINSELGTTYQLMPAPGETYNEMVLYFLNMSLEEFEEYIRECYALGAELDSYTNIPDKNIMVPNTPVSRSSLDKQKYFYDRNSNYFYIEAYTAAVGGTTIYTGKVDSVGYSINEYPAYSAPTYSIEFAEDMKTVTITFNCVRHLSKYVIDGVSYSIDVIFGAGAGDRYPEFIAKYH